MWNSGRLPSISATVSPCPTPSLARPPAAACTRSSSSDQVSETLPPGVRTATISGWAAAVRHSASVSVEASTALPGTAVIVVLSMYSSWPRFPLAAEAIAAAALAHGFLTLMPPSALADVEPLAAERRKVVAEPDHEQQQDQHEADDAGALHDREGNPPAAHLLGQRPEHMAPVERQKREQIDHRQRQRDQSQHLERPRGALGEGFLGDRVTTDDPRQLLALLGFEHARDRRHRLLGDRPQSGDGQRCPVERARIGRAVPDAELEPDQGPLLARAVTGTQVEGQQAPVTTHDHPGRGRRQTATGLRARALVAGDLAAQLGRGSGDPV